jgi:hypothetical protein
VDWGGADTAGFDGGVAAGIVSDGCVSVWVGWSSPVGAGRAVILDGLIGLDRRVIPGGSGCVWLRGWYVIV